MHARPTPTAVLAEAVGPELGARLLRRLSALQPTTPTTAITLPPVSAGYLIRAAAPALPSLPSAVPSSLPASGPS
ncbi:hypothetical protein OG625_20030 [Streptomyces sp. NBC_01351]|uniref:hypothetical protein n=1 Tax=Streptomyces sp. NBC_01351 TaxID=2903833 RepID=UPI002E325522|nr:hypothetical protein [Streptomyces sp. NBC_01351]